MERRFHGMSHQPKMEVSQQKKLTLMLKYMDAWGVIDQSDGIDPMIIVDVHSSRMMGAFLDYVNNPEHRWSAMLGIP
jgi:hypothetical protein